MNLDSKIRIKFSLTEDEVKQMPWVPVYIAIGVGGICLLIWVLALLMIRYPAFNDFILSLSG